jgi:drug/metabolite transporter (DMT)-like permease
MVSYVVLGETLNSTDIFGASLILLATVSYEFKLIDKLKLRSK